MNLPFQTESYIAANSRWPSKGKHILGSFSDEDIIVYQAYNPRIAQWVVEHQTFKGCPEFSMDRMTWIKTNFLWMMYRSGWASKVNQENILAIKVKRTGFEEILRESKQHGRPSQMTSGNSDILVDSGIVPAKNLIRKEDNVRLQWDPDHDPYGTKVERRAIQLGIRKETLQTFINEWVISISDITRFVQSQYEFVRKNELICLQVPIEKIYDISEPGLREHVGVDVNDTCVTHDTICA